MSDVVKYTVPLSLSEMTVEELFSTAEEFGLLWIWHSSMLGKKSWSAKIVFDTVKGVDLEARAENGKHKNPQDALVDAIEKARLVEEQFK